MSLVYQSPPGEQQQCDGEHAIGPEQGPMAVVHGQIGPMLIIVDDGEIDQETEDRGAQEVPE